MAEQDIDRARLEEALRTPVHQGERYVPFGELTLPDAIGRAEAIAAAGGWGPLARAAKVAHAWRDLASQMENAGASSVAELEPETVVRFAEYLWVIPPPDGMI